MARKRIAASIGASEILWPNEPGYWPGPWRIIGHWVEGGPLPECVGLEIWKGVKPEGENVRLLQSADAISGFEATDLRSLPVKEIVSLLWTALLERQEQERDWAAGQLSHDGPTERKRYGALQEMAAAKQYAADRPKRSTGLSNEHFRRVAAIYSSAVKSPTKAVSEAHNVSHSTAAKWVAKAAELGLLSSTTPGVRRRQTNPTANRKRKA